MESKETLTSSNEIGFFVDSVDEPVELSKSPIGDPAADISGVGLGVKGKGFNSDFSDFLDCCDTSFANESTGDDAIAAATPTIVEDGVNDVDVDDDGPKGSKGLKDGGTEGFSCF